ncbi:MAG: phenylalanine--tRNA ligase subunit alpha, partial [Pseudomonadota bacterium]|nr:phenylalanine--tRNA ligase subunit alpha [Pseudomonadota bacterium]
MDALDDIRTRTLAAIDAATDPAALDAVRVAALGKKGDVTGLMKT